jgi:hypothetical protein
MYIKRIVINKTFLVSGKARFRIFLLLPPIFDFLGCGGVFIAFAEFWRPDQNYRNEILISLNFSRYLSAINKSLHLKFVLLRNF